MRGFIIAAISVLLLASAQGHAQSTSPRSVQSLLDRCNHTGDSFDAGLCAGYISGTMDMMTVIGAAPNNEGLKHLGACGRFTIGAAVQAFKNWANQHPSEWDSDELKGVVQALHATWPCKLKPN